MAFKKTVRPSRANISPPRRTDAFSLLPSGVNFVLFLGAILTAVILRHPAYVAVSLSSGAAYYLALTGAKSLRTFGGLSVLFVLLSTLNPLFNPRGQHPLFFLLGRPYTLEALCYGTVTAGMFIAALLWFFCFERIMTGDKLTALMGQKFPALSLLLVMVLRLVPAVRQKAGQIAAARRCVGLEGDGSLWQTVASGMAVLSALTSWFLEGGIITADSMEARGYGTSRRTSLLSRAWSGRDRCFLTVLLALMALTLAGILAGGASVVFLPALSIAPIKGFSCLPLATYAGWLFLPTALDLRERLLWLRAKSKF